MCIYSLEIVKFESRSHVWIQTLFLASNHFLNDDWLVFGVFFSNSEQEDSGFWLGWSISLTKLDKCKYL